MNIPPWLAEFEVTHNEFHDFRSALMNWSVQGGVPVCDYPTLGGIAFDEQSAKGLSDGLKDLGFYVAARDICANSQSSILVHANGFVKLTFAHRRKAPKMPRLRIQGVTTSEDVAEKVFGLAKEHINPVIPRKRWLHVIVEELRGGGSRLALNRLAEIDDPLVRRNYAPKVLEGYDHILADLGRPDPCGKLVLLEGPPGTGKTFMVRALISMAERAHFAVVPSSLVERLGEPRFLPALLKAPELLAQQGRETRVVDDDDDDEVDEIPEDWPLVLVLEDAESALLPRGEGGALDAVSAVLNMSDGLLASALNLRLLVTTNASKMRLDEAVHRVGRLCRHVHIGELPDPQAQEVLTSLGGQTLPTTGESRHPLTLAEVYRAARLQTDDAA